jgi:hypothetical protein
MHFLFKSKDMPGKLPRRERITAYTVIVLTLLLRLIYVFRYRINSDEPQHLHVVWGWVSGLLPYLNMFDNHTPLFHLLCVPLYRMIGDTPAVLFAMRLAMIPLYVMVLWCTYIIGREIFSRRVGLWAAVFTGLYPFNFLSSVEFRPDSLWAAIWMLAIVLMVRERLRIGKSFWIGFLLGAAIGVSLKTCLLIATLGTAAFLTVVFFTEHNWIWHSLRRFSQYAVAMLVGFFIIPATLILFLYSKGALGAFFYQVIDNNLYVFTGFGLWNKLFTSVPLFILSLALLFCIARITVRHIASKGMQTRCIFILFVASIYWASLNAFLPIIEPEHYLPWYPLFMIMLTSIVWKLCQQWNYHKPGNARINGLPRWAFVSLVVSLEAGLLLGLGEGAPWRDGTHSQIQLLKEVLQLTEPGDYVVDLKGETIFRPRSSYYVLEKITRRQIKRGLVIDDIPERLIATHTCVAVPDSKKFPARTRTFLTNNYLPVGNLRVAGKLLEVAHKRNAFILFSILITAYYAIITPNGSAAGTLDGTQYDGPRFLTAGDHEFRPSATNSRFALVWAPAVERGFSPFLMEN